MTYHSYGKAMSRAEQAAHQRKQVDLRIGHNLREECGRRECNGMRPLTLYLIRKNGRSGTGWDYLRVLCILGDVMWDLTDDIRFSQSVGWRRLTTPRGVTEPKQTWLRLQRGGYSVSVFLREFQNRCAEVYGVPITYINL